MIATKPTPIGCEANGCCGHGSCNCDADFTVALSRFGSSIVVDGKAWQLKRKVRPGSSSYEVWDLTAL